MCKNDRPIAIAPKSDVRQPGNPDHVTGGEARQFMDSQGCAAFIACSVKDNREIDRILPACVHGVDRENERYCFILYTSSPSFIVRNSSRFQEECALEPKVLISFA
jgi:hypothetical protein